jgi:hypothetical protein
VKKFSISEQSLVCLFANSEAADIMKNNPDQFEQLVKKSLRGGLVLGHQFERLL